jgi:hypothetical protein
MIELVFLWIFGIICGLVVAWKGAVLLLCIPLGLLHQRDVSRAIRACADGMDP